MRERALTGSGEADVAPCVEVAKVVIVVDIEDNVFGRMRLLDNFHPFVRLIDAVASDTEVFNRLPLEFALTVVDKDGVESTLFVINQFAFFNKKGIDDYIGYFFVDKIGLDCKDIEKKFKDQLAGIKKVECEEQTIESGLEFVAPGASPLTGAFFTLDDAGHYFFLLLASILASSFTRRATGSFIPSSSRSQRATVFGATPRRSAI